MCWLAYRDAVNMNFEKKQFPGKSSDYYFCDDFNKRFYATEAQIWFAILELNRLITVCGGACLNDFYNLLGEKPTIIGNMYLWDSAYMDYENNCPWVDIQFEDHYIGDELTYRLHYSIPPSMDHIHPEDI